MDRKYKYVLTLVAFLIAMSFIGVLTARDAARNDLNRAKEFALHGKYEQSLRALDNAIRLDPEYAPAHLERARVFLRLSKSAGALKECNVAIALDPKFAEAYSIRSLTLSSLKQYRAAIDDADKAMSLTSAMFPYISRANAYLGLGKYKQALADCNKALAVEKNPQSFYIRARVYFDSGEYKNAVDDCTRAIEGYPQAPVFYETRAMAYEKLGDAKSALKDWETFKSLRSSSSKSTPAQKTQEYQGTSLHFADIRPKLAPPALVSCEGNNQGQSRHQYDGPRGSSKMVAMDKNLIQPN